MIPKHMKRLDELTEAWRVGPAGARLDAVRAGARQLRERLHQGKPVKSVRTYDLITLPYPTRYGLCDASSSLLPFLMMTNRMQLVTVATDEGPKRLLVNPSDHERDAETPFFKRMAGKMPDFVNRLVAKRHSDVPRRLDEAGVRGDQIDYITFDHLHTQDVRRLMLEWCPRAKLLAHKDELAIFERLHPLQADWYVADSLRGIPSDRILPFDGDLLVGEGVALVHTPGHTAGNHSIVLHTDRGLWTISENGVSPDNYTPERSEIGGVAASARAAGVEVILNANTRELSLEQYTSMVLEKTLADTGTEGWPQVFNSSELTPSALLPGLAPTFAHRAITHGPEPA
jgi:glyoxylase-like metal-dependent hydrolase (beta-lactamase superfamily II)